MCVIKEEDLLLCMDNIHTVPVPKYPVRVAMNNKTITLFTSDVHIYYNLYIKVLFRNIVQL